MNTIEQLKTLLGAISESRTNYELIISRKFDSLVAEFQPSNDEDYRVLYVKALMSPEAREAHQQLVNVYGCLGNQSSEFYQQLQKISA